MGLQKLLPVYIGIYRVISAPGPNVGVGGGGILIKESPTLKGGTWGIV